MSVTSSTPRTTIAGTVALIAALALTGCAGTGGAGTSARSTDSDGATHRPSARSTAPSDTPSPSSSASAGAAELTDLTFEDGAAVPASSLPAFGLEVSALDGWTQTGEDTTAGSREYTRSDGAVATVTQQRITDLDPSIGDRAATEQLFTAAGLPAERLEEQLLPTATGGTAQFLSIAGHQSDGTWSATVARAFAKPGAALVVKVRTDSQDRLRPDLHEILVHAQVVLT
jgi:hypothetical protein